MAHRVALERFYSETEEGISHSIPELELSSWFANTDSLEESLFPSSQYIVCEHRIMEKCVTWEYTPSRSYTPSCLRSYRNWVDANYVYPGGLPMPK